MDDERIEALASSFYAVEYNSHSWNCAPEIIKDEFRLYARSAIELCSSEYVSLDDQFFPEQKTSSGIKKYIH
jgi:hypothetical protein